MIIWKQSSITKPKLCFLFLNDSDELLCRNQSLLTTLHILQCNLASCHLILASENYEWNLLGIGIAHLLLHLRLVWEYLYTGAIFEVKALDTPMGSITGGGRYDNLTGIFGLPGLSGVGISFGADRIYDVLNALDLYPKEAVNSTQVLFINFGEKETAYCLPIVRK